MAKAHLTCPSLKIGDVNFMNSGMLCQVDLSPASFLAKLPNPLAKLDAHIWGHLPSIDLVQALYLADTLSAGIQ